jgi:hypothetical protein
MDKGMGFQDPLPAEQKTMELGQQQKTELLAREVSWKLGHRLPCSKCADWKPEQESMGWRLIHKPRGIEFICRGANFWGCDKIRGLSAHGMIELGKEFAPEIVQSLEQGLFGRGTCIYI